MFNQTIPSPAPELQARVNLIPRVLRGEREREEGGGGVQVREDPWKEVGPDSTYAVNGFDLLFVFALVMMLGIKFNMCIMFKLRKLQFRK